MSHLEHRLNTLVMIICTLQAILCTLMAIGCSTYLSGTSYDDRYAHSARDPDGTPQYTDLQYSIINFFTYFLLVNTLLPISLQVCLEFCKFFQAYYINNDVLMFSFEREQLVQCKSMPLVEELGQVSYIFSDKTGTLTRNVMEFKYMLIGQSFYGNQKEFNQIPAEEGEDERNAFRRKSTMRMDQHQESNQTKVWSCPNYNAIIAGSNNYEVNRKISSLNSQSSFTIKTQRDMVVEFMKILSLAHSCEVEFFKDKTGVQQKFYNGPSPDEVALVEFAACAKFDCFKSSEEIISMAMQDG